MSGRRCTISRARITRSYMHTRYPDGAAKFHGFGTPDRTCIEGIRKGLQYLRGKEHQIVNAYEISGPGCRVSRVRTNIFNMPTYKVSGRGCRILRIRHIRSNLPTRYQFGVAGSHGLGTIDRTCLLGTRRGLQDLTGSKHRSNVPITGRCQDGLA